MSNRVINSAVRRWKDSPHDDIRRLAGPTFVSNITIPLLGIVDTAVMGHLDHPVYLAGVALGSGLIGFLWWLMNFLRMGTTGLCAQYAGQQNYQACYLLLRQGCALAIGIAVLLLLIHPWLISFALHWTQNQSEVSQLAANYVSIRIWGAPAYFLIYVFHGWLLGRQNALLPVLVLIGMNVLNILLDLLFVIEFKWGLEGAALASLLSEYAGVLIAGVIIYRFYLSDRELIDPMARAGLKFRDFFVMNRDILLRSLMLQLCFLSIPYLGSRQSEVIMAANAVLLNMLLLLAFALDAYAHAAEALVGRAIGSGSQTRTQNTIFGCFGWAFFTSLAITLLFAIGQYPIVHVLTDLDDVITEVYRYWGWIVGLPLVGVWCFTLDGIFIGAARGKDMRNNMFWASGLGFLPCAWGLLPWLGNHAVWLGIWLLMIIRGVGLGWRAWQFNRSGWQHLSV